MRKTARLKLEYIHLDSMNMTLTQALAQCDSVQDVQVDVIIRLDDLLGIKEDKIVNLKLQNQMGLEMYDMADHAIKREKKLKWIFVGTTVLMAGFLTLSLL